MESIWRKDCQIPIRDSLSGNMTCEIAVIGAGMAGLLTAYQLQKSGHEVVVLEADRIASGQTGNTTAKITSQHGLIYDKLIFSIGLEKAGAYAAANERAIREYQRIIEEEKIECMFEPCSAFVYGDDTIPLRWEVRAAAKLGLPAIYLDEPEAPVPCKGAVCFKNQAQFHPLFFLRSIAEKLTIYEHTPVRSVKNHLIQTDHGTVTAKRIIFACHYPFLKLAGLYFTRLHQERSYVLALEHAEATPGMWIGAGKDALSFRTFGSLLLLGGGGHRTGENSFGGQYDDLMQRAEDLYPNAGIVAKWSAQDCVTPDRLPLIGRFSASHPDWYVATGFRKWGMTSSMVSAMLIQDLIEGKTPSCAEVFDPGRFPAGVLSGLAQEGRHAVKGQLRRLFYLPKTITDQISNGQGGVVRFHGKKAGVYKDPEGKIYAVSVCCPHLGCQLEWNPEELSWDCPCHGSRFDVHGHLITGPAMRNLHRFK